jgi:uncharacterized membrane protein SpoIIM required for sporulation
MRETKFIEQNQQKWNEFEKVLEKGTENPEELNDLFIQITDDLSFSRTFYPNRSVRVYLNGLAQRVFNRIYKNKKSFRGRFSNFWLQELPQLMHESRVAFRVSFFVFVLSLAIGVLSSAMDPGFAEVILGPGYIDMTIDNIESGDPMAVYKDKGAFGMSLGITINNLFVSFLIFVFGAFFSIGSIIHIIRNGVMVGAFQYFFIERDLFWDSFLTIWIHGTLEMSAMVIAGAAGITMGRGLVFPGNYSRAKAFQQSARRGIKIMVGIIPIIILAGFFEGYLTRHTETPDFMRGLFIFICLAFVLIYFVWYPWMLGKRGFDKPLTDVRVSPDKDQQIQFKKIKNVTTQFGDVFVFFKKNSGVLLLASALVAALFTVLTFAFTDSDPVNLFYFPTYLFGSLSVVNKFFSSEVLYYIPLLMGGSITILTFITFTLLRREEQFSEKTSRTAHFSNVITAIVAGGLVELVLWMNSGFTVILLIFIVPLVLLWQYTSHREQVNLFSAIPRMQTVLSGNYGKLIGIFSLLLFSGLFFYSLADTALVNFFFEVINWVVHFDQSTMDSLTIILLTFLNMFLLNLLLIIIASGVGIAYYNLLEINEAGELLRKIKTIDLKRRIRGLERE